MTELELKTMLSNLKIDNVPIDCYYDHFVATPTKPYLKPPFVLYRVTSVDTLKADDKVHSQYNNYIVDLAVESNATTLETELEGIFNDNYIPYDKEKDYLTNERIYQIRYFI